MTFLLVLVITTVICVALKDVIHKHPAPFYIIALVLSLLYALTSYVVFPFWLQRLLFILMQKGTLATALFVVVMYIGVFKETEVVRHSFMPIRARLSILACILILGHIVKYLSAYLPRFSVIPESTQFGVVIAIVSFLLMLVLGVTSFQAIHKRMSNTAWIKLQKTAYIFYGLVWLHLVILLLPSALSGSGATAVASIAIYTVVFGVYAILRIGKAIRDKGKKSAAAENSPALHGSNL